MRAHALRRALGAGLGLLLVALAAPAALTEPAKLMLVRVAVTDRDEAQFLLHSFDETHNHGNGQIELLLHPGDPARLRALGFSYEVVEDDLGARDGRLHARPGPRVALPGPDRDDYRRLADYEAEMRALAKKHRSLVRLVRLPYETLEGRRVLGVEIAADVRRRDGRPTFYVDGVHHAREWPAGEYPMIFAHHLVERSRKDARVTRLLRKLRVVIVPVVNPDGFDYSREALLDPQGAAATGPSAAGLESYWRKNRRSLSGATVPVAQRNPDAYGVDPNRNYSFLWGASNGSSGAHPQQDYRGSEPFSEPETLNVRDLILSRQVTGVVTNHTYGRLVLRAWGHTVEDAPDEPLLRTIGGRMARAMGGYTNQKGIGLYATTGTTDDWAYATTGALGYTFEHESSFHPPYAGSVGKNWRGVVEAFTIMGETAANPRHHAVITGRIARGGGGRKAHLALRRSTPTPLGEGNPTGRKRVREVFATDLFTRVGRRFEWHVNPSTRPVAARSEAYQLEISAGGRCDSVTVRVRRGQRLDLGTIRLMDTCDRIVVVGAP